MNLRIIGTLGILLGAAGALVTAGEPAGPAAMPATVEATPAPGISPHDLAARLERRDPDLAVLDVRSEAEFEAGHVPGARHIPHDALKARLAELAPLKAKDVVLYCRSGRRAQLAAQILREAGYQRILQLEGDYPGWEASQKAEVSPTSIATD